MQFIKITYCYVDGKWNTIVCHKTVKCHLSSCGLSLLVLYSAPRGFSPGTPVFPFYSFPKDTALENMTLEIKFIIMLWNTTKLLMPTDGDHISNLLTGTSEELH